MNGDALLRAFARRLPPDPASALAQLRRHRLPVSVISAFVDDLTPGLTSAAAWQAALSDEAVRAQRIRRAAAIVEDLLAGIDGLALAGDALGYEWSSDVDVFATPDALVAASAALQEAGSVALDGLLARVGGAGGRPSPPRHFAIVEGAEILAPAELSSALWERGEPAAPAIRRAVASPGGLPRLMPDDAARRRVAKLAAARRPTLRGAIELSALLERGVTMRAAGPALRRYAALEHDYGVNGPISDAVASVRPRPSREWSQARLRALRREGTRRIRPRQVRIAFCGIDGAGKSTQVRLLVDNLDRMGIGAHASWTRIGNAASGPIERLARTAQRLLPTGSHSFQATRAAAGREATAETGPPDVAPPLTRRGPLGWSWALAVTLDYLCRSIAASRRAAGSVLVLDRALPDALVELQDDYGIVLRLGLHRWLLTRFTPVPHTTCYLRLPGAVAKARKDDMFTAAELELHIRAYERELAGLPGVVVLDAQRSPDELALEALRAVARAA